MTGRRTWRESLTEYRHIDDLQHELATMLGIVDDRLGMNDVKALYWTANPVGDALAKFLFALASAGVLEAHPEDETMLRFHPSFRGWWEDKKAR
jgi:hypothetical protein